MQFGRLTGGRATWTREHPGHIPQSRRSLTTGPAGTWVIPRGVCRDKKVMVGARRDPFLSGSSRAQRHAGGQSGLGPRVGCPVVGSAGAGVDHLAPLTRDPDLDRAWVAPRMKAKGPGRQSGGAADEAQLRSRGKGGARAPTPVGLHPNGAHSTDARAARGCSGVHLLAATSSTLSVRITSVKTAACPQPDLSNIGQSRARGAFLRNSHYGKEARASNGSTADVRADG